MNNSHDPLHTGEVPDQLADPHSAVGDYVRRRNNLTSQSISQWAQIAMTVPSASGLCWMVCFIDGEVDVWRVDDDSACYEFRRAEKADRS